MESEQQAEAVVLSDKKIEQLSKQPIIESFVSRSQDGRLMLSFGFHLTASGKTAFPESCWCAWHLLAAA